MTAPLYLQLQKGGVYARMFNLRMIADQSKRDNRPPSMHLADWRAARAYGFHNVASAYCELSQGFDGSEGMARTPVWYCHTGEQFRHEIDCNKVTNSRIDHTGWYVDSDCSEMAIGIVAMLSHGRFIAGYRLTDSDERVYFPTVYSDKWEADREAAWAANEHARVFAERARESDEKFSEARQLEYDIDDALVRLRECIVLRHESCMEYVRAEISELCESIRTKRDDLTNNYAEWT